MNTRIAICTTAASLLVACSSGSNDIAESVPPQTSNPQPGTLSLKLVDAPVEDVAEVWIEFDSVSLVTPDGTTESFDFAEPLSVDLLTLVDGEEATLIDNAPLPAGVYSDIRLAVNAEFDGVFDSYVMTDEGEQIELRVPSGAQSGLKVIDDITITDNAGASFVLDWDVRKGLVDPRGQPGYFLKPTIRVIDESSFGVVSGTVSQTLLTDETCTNDLAQDEGNAIYIYSGLDATPADIAGLDTDPVATVAVLQDQDGEYRYSASLTPGEYTVAFTCQASIDDPEIDESTNVPEGQDEASPILFSLSPDSNVTVADGEEYSVSFD